MSETTKIETSPKKRNLRRVGAGLALLATAGTAIGIGIKPEGAAATRIAPAATEQIAEAAKPSTDVKVSSTIVAAPAEQSAAATVETTTTTPAVTETSTTAGTVSTTEAPITTEAAPTTASSEAAPQPIHVEADPTPAPAPGPIEVTADPTMPSPELTTPSTGTTIEIGQPRVINSEGEEVTITIDAAGNEVGLIPPLSIGNPEAAAKNIQNQR